jgi:hypothetical protein
VDFGEAAPSCGRVLQGCSIVAVSSGVNVRRLELRKKRKKKGKQKYEETTRPWN